MHAFHGPRISLHICNHIHFQKKFQHNLQKMVGGEGGVKGRWEFFQQFIQFGSVTLPLLTTDVSSLLIEGFSFASINAPRTGLVKEIL